MCRGVEFRSAVRVPSRYLLRSFEVVDRLSYALGRFPPRWICCYPICGLILDDERCGVVGFGRICGIPLNGEDGIGGNEVAEGLWRVWLLGLDLIINRIDVDNLSVAFWSCRDNVCAALYNSCRLYIQDVLVDDTDNAREAVRVTRPLGRLTLRLQLCLPGFLLSVSSK